MVGTSPAADKKAEQVPVSDGRENSGTGVAPAEAEGAAELGGPNCSPSRRPLDCEEHSLMKVLKARKEEVIGGDVLRE